MIHSYDATIRLGLALYRKSVLGGDGFYKLYDLVFEDIQNQTSSGLFGKFFAKSDDNFWSTQEELARSLDSSGLATVQRRQIAGYRTEYLLKITPFGRAIYSIAHLQSDVGKVEIEGIRIDDVDHALKNDEDALAIEDGIRALDNQFDELKLSNFQRSTVNAYSNVLIAICQMPDRDVKLFWMVLERLSHFAGVASLITAIIALRLARF